MSALPTTTTLRALPALRPAAAAALDVDPEAVLRRWHAGLSEGTRKRYGTVLATFYAWATGDKGSDPASAMRLLVGADRVGCRNLLLGFREWLETQGRSSGTVACYLSGLCSLVTAARLAGIVEWHVEQVAPRIEPRHDRSGPGRGAVERLLEHLDDLAAAGEVAAIRDVAIVRLLHNAALRRREVCGLRVRDFEPNRGTVAALRKGKRERETLLVGTMATKSIQAWLPHRGAVGPDDPLFVRMRPGGGVMSGEAIRLLLAKRWKQAGLRGTCRPHGLRHAAATHCARNASLAALKRLGGWVTLSSPARYLDADDRDRQAAIVCVEV